MLVFPYMIGLIPISCQPSREPLEVGPRLYQRLEVGVGQPQLRFTSLKTMETPSSHVNCKVVYRTSNSWNPNNSRTCHPSRCYLGSPHNCQADLSRLATLLVDKMDASLQRSRRFEFNFFSAPPEMFANVDCQHALLGKKGQGTL